MHLLSVIWKDDHWSLITPNSHLSAYSDYQVPNHSADSSLLPQHLLQVNLVIIILFMLTDSNDHDQPCMAGQVFAACILQCR